MGELIDQDVVSLKAGIGPVRARVGVLRATAALGGLALSAPSVAQGYRPSGALGAGAPALHLAHATASKAVSAKPDQATGFDGTHRSALAGLGDRRTSMRIPVSTEATPRGNGTAETAIGDPASVSAGAGGTDIAPGSSDRPTPRAASGGLRISPGSRDHSAKTVSSTRAGNSRGSIRRATHGARSARSLNSPGNPRERTQGGESAGLLVITTTGAHTAANASAAHRRLAQALREKQGGSGSGTASTGGPESNTTAQAIWQVQISDCTAHCQGTRQVQAGQQRVIMVQVVKGAMPSAASSRTEAREGHASQLTSDIRQIQVGCVHHCYGRTTTNNGPISGGIRWALRPLLPVLPPAGLPSLNRTLAIDHSIGANTAYRGKTQRPLAAQRQTASQTTITDPVVHIGSSLSSGLGAARGQPESAPTHAIDQTAQAIWQLQIGCIVFCAHTDQDQRAEQSNTTVQRPLPAAVSSTGSAGANIADQLIWQLQIGCLLWCYDATERQTAASHKTLAVTSNLLPTAYRRTNPALTPSDAQGTPSQRLSADATSEWHPLRQGSSERVIPAAYSSSALMESPPADTRAGHVSTTTEARRLRLTSHHTPPSIPTPSPTDQAQGSTYEMSPTTTARIYPPTATPPVIPSLTTPLMPITSSGPPPVKTSPVRSTLPQPAPSWRPGRPPLAAVPRVATANPAAVKPTGEPGLAVVTLAALALCFLSVRATAALRNRRNQPDDRG